MRGLRARITMHRGSNSTTYLDHTRTLQHYNVCPMWLQSTLYTILKHTPVPLSAELLEEVCSDVELKISRATFIIYIVIPITGEGLLKVQSHLPVLG